MSNFQKLFELLTEKQRRGLIFLSFLLIVVSVMEIFFLQSILIIVEFISGQQNASFFKFAKIQNFINNFNYPEIFLLALFLIFFLSKVLINIIVLKYEADFIYRTRENFTKKFFINYLSLPKLFHVKMSIANLLKKIIIQVEDLGVAIRSLITIVLEILILILITVYLLTINFYLTVYIFTIFMIASLILLKFNKKKFVNLGKEQIFHNENRVKVVNEIFTSLKFFKNFQFKENITKKFNFHNKRTNDIAIAITFKNNYLRPLFELIILIVFVSTLLFMFLNNYEIKKFLPQFAVFLAASYRLMPSYARILASINTYKYHIQPVNEYYSDKINLFPEKLPLKNPSQIIQFNDNINLNNISFSYNIDNQGSKKLILSNLNLNIKKNSKICILGESGSGKSTLLEILMGLLQPHKDSVIKIDGKKTALNNDKWQDKIGFVPQNIFITTDTLKKNIALGFEEKDIDIDNLKYCLKFSNLHNFVSNLKNGMDEKISDAGTNISGGQKQRIGIARAIYSKPEILILDEPLNNLDEKNELEILGKILDLQNVTVILTTHKKNNLLSKFDQILEMKNLLKNE